MKNVKFKQIDTFQTIKPNRTLTTENIYSSDSNHHTSNPNKQTKKIIKKNDKFDEAFPKTKSKPLNIAKHNTCPMGDLVKSSEYNKNKTDPKSAKDNVPIKALSKNSSPKNDKVKKTKVEIFRPADQFSKTFKPKPFNAHKNNAKYINIHVNDNSNDNSHNEINISQGNNIKHRNNEEINKDNSDNNHNTNNNSDNGAFLHKILAILGSINPIHDKTQDLYQMSRDNKEILRNLEQKINEIITANSDEILENDEDSIQLINAKSKIRKQIYQAYLSVIMQLFEDIKTLASKRADLMNKIEEEVNSITKLTNTCNIEESQMMEKTSEIIMNGNQNNKYLYSNKKSSKDIDFDIKACNLNNFNGSISNNLSNSQFISSIRSDYYQKIISNKNLDEDRTLNENDDLFCSPIFSKKNLNKYNYDAKMLVNQDITINTKPKEENIFSLGNSNNNLIKNKTSRELNNNKNHNILDNELEKQLFSKRSSNKFKTSDIIVKHLQHQQSLSEDDIIINNDDTEESMSSNYEFKGGGGAPASPKVTQNPPKINPIFIHPRQLLRSNINSNRNNQNNLNTPIRRKNYNTLRPTNLNTPKIIKPIVQKPQNVTTPRQPNLVTPRQNQNTVNFKENVICPRQILRKDICPKTTGMSQNVKKFLTSANTNYLGSNSNVPKRQTTNNQNKIKKKEEEQGNCQIY